LVQMEREILEEFGVKMAVAWTKTLAHETIKNPFTLWMTWKRGQ
jgi:hypothetical protein